jgi:hypothetical protein
VKNITIVPHDFSKSTIDKNTYEFTHKWHSPKAHENITVPLSEALLTTAWPGICMEMHMASAYLNSCIYTNENYAANTASNHQFL